MDKRYIKILCNVLLASTMVCVPSLMANVASMGESNAVEKQKYDAWKEAKKEEWVQYDRKTPADQIWMLLGEISYYLGQDDKTEAFYAYNYLRELKNQLLATDIAQIDQNWIYTIWKEAKKERWTKKGYKSLTLQISDLIRDISFNLKFNYDIGALHAYNYLRELKNWSLAKDISQIDHNWIAEQDYIAWKEEQKERLTKKGYKSLAQQLYNLAQNIPLDLKSGYNTEALHGYNYLSELLNKPTISDVSKIDQQWLNELTKASDSSVAEQEYSRWKEWKQERWAQNDKTSLDEQTSDLISQVPYYLGHNDKTEALYAYNYLRELLHQSLATNISQIDQNWVAQQDYIAWKEEKKEEWTGTNNIRSLIAQTSDLISNVLQYLRQDDKTEDDKIEAFYAYNYLRELLNRPTISDLSKIDQQWLNEVTKAADGFAIIEGRHGFEPASAAQKALIKEAQAIIGLQKEITTYGIRSELGLGGQTFEAAPLKAEIGLSQTPDLDERLSIVYHELAHLINNDSINTQAIEKGEKSPKEFLDSPAFTADLARIKQYIDLGSKALDKSTEIGKRINYILKQYPVIRSKDPYWEPPQDKDLYNKQVYLRGAEQRADLFMLDELFKQNQINPILRWIEEFGNTSYIVAIGDEDPHPSNFERALYAAGFLVDKGRNINQDLREWGNRGICIDAEKLYHSKTPFASTEGIGAIDFLRAYQQWQKAHQAEDYQQWKEGKKAEYELTDGNKKTNVYKIQNNLLWDLNRLIESLASASLSPNEDYKSSMLYNYNFLRELNNLPVITDISQIDQNWVAQQKYLVWKEMKKEEWAQWGYTSAEQIAEQIQSFRLAIPYHLKQNSNVEALYEYNYLRELENQPLATDVTQIDQNWVAQQ